MSNSSSDDLNAPIVDPFEHNNNKYGFTGILIGAILHGIVIVLFCQCMGALLGPTNRKHKTGGIRWGLVALTTVMFLLSTTALALNIRWLSPYCIRVHYYANDTLLLSGPLGYQYHINTLSDIATSIISLNQWLADGLLLYRCHVIYDMNYRVTAFPCLIYLASVAVGIVFLHATSQIEAFLSATQTISLYLAITFSLNILLTLMIVGRLALFNQEVRASMGISSRDDLGTSSRAGELYKAIATIFVESCAPYAIILLLYLVANGIDSMRVNVFYPIFIEIQVIAPFLIILRLANRTAVTSDSTIGSRTVDSARFGSHEETTCGHGDIFDDGPVSSTDVSGEALNELSVGDGMAIEEVPLYDGSRAGSGSGK